MVNQTPRLSGYDSLFIRLKEQQCNRIKYIQVLFEFATFGLTEKTVRLSFMLKRPGLGRDQKIEAVKISIESGRRISVVFAVKMA